MNSPKTILLVEDDPDIRAMITAMLGPSDYHITEADNISVAMHEISNGKSFDLAILDFWLGKDHAVEIMDAMRFQAPDLPVIIISGGNGSMDIEKTQAISDVSGAVKFLQKPFRKADLLAALASATK